MKGQLTMKRGALGVAFGRLFARIIFAIPEAISCGIGGNRASVSVSVDAGPFRGAVNRYAIGNL